LARPVTLYAFADGDDLVVVGSRGGAKRDPAWVGNLRAHPHATVRHGKGGDARPVVAREATGRNRDRLWDLVTTAFPMYRAFQRRTERTIPLFALKPAKGG
jgi:deazaflavin-dependent oxidoreductase (nitroreductase family)